MSDWLHLVLIATITILAFRVAALPGWRTDRALAWLWAGLLVIRATAFAIVGHM